MLTTSIALAKRFVLLLPGIIIAYLSVRVIFPLFDHHLPLALAIFATYVLAAYLLIPAFIRLVRILFPPEHLPLYCITPDGFASDPINIGLVGTKQELMAAMEAVGWYVADPKTIRTVIRQILSAVYGWSYPTAPMSNLYLFGRRQDIGFEIPAEGGFGSRRHVRFWATTYDDSKDLSVRSIHWHNRESLYSNKKLLWVGAASRDVGLAPIRHNFQVTHMIHPDTDSERMVIVKQLQRADIAGNCKAIKLGNPYRIANRALRGYLQSDGQMQILELK